MRHRALYTSTYPSASKARRAVVAFATSAGFAGEQLDDLQSAVGEALANAVEHGYTPSGMIAVDATFSEGSIVIEIADGGRGFSKWERPVPSARNGDSPRGFGMHIMHATTDRVEYLEGGRRVRLTKRLAIVKTTATTQREP